MARARAFWIGWRRFISGKRKCAIGIKWTAIAKTRMNKRYTNGGVVGEIEDMRDTAEIVVVVGTKWGFVSKKRVESKMKSRLFLQRARRCDILNWLMRYWEETQTWKRRLDTSCEEIAMSCEEIGRYWETIRDGLVKRFWNLLRSHDENEQTFEWRVSWTRPPQVQRRERWRRWWRPPDLDFNRTVLVTSGVGRNLKWEVRNCSRCFFILYFHFSILFLSLSSRGGGGGARRLGCVMRRASSVSYVFSGVRHIQISNFHQEEGEGVHHSQYGRQSIFLFLRVIL